jgi:hypothetical protein
MGSGVPDTHEEALTSIKISSRKTFMKTGWQRVNKPLSSKNWVGCSMGLQKENCHTWGPSRWREKHSCMLLLTNSLPMAHLGYWQWQVSVIGQAEGYGCQEPLRACHGDS